MGRSVVSTLAAEESIHNYYLTVLLASVGVPLLVVLLERRSVTVELPEQMCVLMLMAVWLEQEPVSILVVNHSYMNEVLAAQVFETRYLKQYSLLALLRYDRVLDSIAP